MINRLMVLAVLVTALGGCVNSATDLCKLAANPETCTAIDISDGDPEATAAIQTALLAAQPGSVVQIPAGTFDIRQELTITVNDVTIRGAGKGKTFLNFSNQIAGAGAAGIKGEAISGLVVEDLAVLNTTGDGVVCIECSDVTFRNIRVEWQKGPDPDNGLYGIYPLRCDGVLVEGTEVRGSSDAGVYVGESNNIIVRNNNAWENVSGIQIENSFDSEVYDNVATNNTLGIFVFDLPNKLRNKNGGRHLIRNNHAMDNNVPNFADPEQIAGDAPVGTGMLIMGTRQVEVRDNHIENNGAMAVAVVSYLMTLREISDPQYYPYPMTIFVHSNTVIGGGTTPIPDDGGAIQDVSLVLSNFFTQPDQSIDVPDLILDGVFSPVTAETGNSDNPSAICFKNNTRDGEPAELANINGPALGVTDPSIEFSELLARVDPDIVIRYDDPDDNPFECDGESQSAVSLSFVD